MKDKISSIVNESVSVKQQAVKDNMDALIQAVDQITSTLKNNGKIIIFGNGGSAADSQHIAAEFIGRFQKERKSLAAMALTTDTSILTALGNDYGFDVVFSRQIEGIAHPGDVAIGISTSGNSANVIKGLAQAKKMGLRTISLTGCSGGKMAGQSDIDLVVPSNVTARIQESHILLAHMICELVEDHFANSN